MAEDKNLELYNRYAEPPEEAKKTIGAGKLKGFTDVNPMWRIRALTEAFGPVGFGWYTKTTRQWLEPGPDGRVAAFCNIELYVKMDGEWSMPIEGTGGSAFVNIFKGNPETSDEAYKMAYTDALSVACKALGMAAHVYWQQGRTKYSATTAEYIKPDDLDKLKTLVNIMNGKRVILGQNQLSLEEIVKFTYKDKSPRVVEEIPAEQFGRLINIITKEINTKQQMIAARTGAEEPR